MTEFKYHHGCKELKFVNLCFADDLMIFCHSDAISTSIIKDAIEEFSGVYGLLPNLSKSSLFFGSMQKSEKDRIMKVMKFNEGILPTKYFCVPLITKKLGVNEYRGLIDKIKGRTKEWKYKYLFYAGRLMLIATILESIIMVTLQKEELKLPGSRFNITSKKDSLWVKWIHEMRLKESSIWNVQWNDVDVWNWKCLLDVRDKISNKLQYEVRNRISVQMWYDRWHNNGLLIDKNWPSDWCRSDFKIMDIRPPRLNTGKQDKVKCRNDNQLIPFYTKLVMKYLSPGYDKVDWYDIVWFKQCIPKHSFCLWLAMKERLPTQDKVMAWGNKDLLCGKKNGNNIWSVVRRLSLAAVVYYIWQESCDLEPLSLDLELHKIINLASLLDHLCNSMPSCDLVSLDQHAHTLYHLESCLTISLDNL
ncbi:RNA-directed DNA polymerase, eukaryota, reverse transcriptase zinc-binding domain protein [Tanacetum coccineum]|uniref:RNA-directed DNA polymerase, eukaryota, reverse transcriptase zinc-binding domain protein n=1 Tax=Tanacetum coccineum TaxID=301880 RepID=A0ABQ5EXW0_9ASTR